MSHSGYAFTLLIALLAPALQTMAQEGKLKKFVRLSAPEKRWVYAHPFIAGKAMRISEHAKKVGEAQADSSDLDKYSNGGQLDAFRHCFWMASLCQEIKEKKALKLGIAHEEGNEKDFKKRQNEDGDLPDAVANAMDLWNNQIGSVLIQEAPEVSEEVLIFAVKTAVTMGRCKIIKRNEKGQFLSQLGTVVTHEDWHGKWINSRCLVSSDQINL